MALVLTHKAGDVVQVGDCWITVQSIRGGRIRLVYDAPVSVRILRNPEAVTEDIGSAVVSGPDRKRAE